MASVVLLNPPGSRPYIRDGYCSLVGRRAYRFPPMDLLVQQPLLRAAGARVTVVEAIGADLEPGVALDRVQRAAPDLVLTLLGSASEPEDAAFLGRVRESCPRAQIVASGDITQFDAAGALARHPFLDGALLDFTAPDLLDALHGRGSALTTRDRSAPAPSRSVFRYGAPDYEAFPFAAYRLPYFPGRVGSPLASFGCPFRCTFCNTSRIPWKLREPDDFALELQSLAGRGVRHHYVRDATFGVDKAHRSAILDVLRRTGATWNTFTRIDLWDPSDFPALAAAGCKVLQLGLETGDAAALRALGKPLIPERVREGITAARAAGIAVCGHFMLGLPGQDAATDAATVRFAVDAGCDFANFSIAEPRPGAPFADRFPAGFSASPAALAARDAAMRRFYLDPRTLLRTARRLRSPADLAHYGKQALNVFGAEA